MKKIDIYDENGLLTLKQQGEDIDDDFVIGGRTAIRYIEEIGKKNATEFKLIDTYIETNLMLHYKDMSICLHDLQNLGKNGHLGYLKSFEAQVDRLEEKERLENIKKNHKEKSPKVTRENKHSNKKMKFVKPIALVLAGGLTAGVAVSFIKGDKDTSNKGNDEPTYSYSDTEKTYSTNTDNDITNTISNDSSLTEGPIHLVQDMVMQEKIEDEAIFLDISEVGNRTETDKAQYARDLYGETIEKYSNMYGVDPELMLAIATQERGKHSSKKDVDGATGLMQIQNSVWVGTKIDAYNYETGKVDSFVVTEDMLGNLETNIKIGCMYFQDCLKNFNYNPLMAIQCYNYGYGNLNNVINTYSKATGKDRKSIINDQQDTGWMNYRNTIRYGDTYYVEHVCSYLTDGELTFMNNNNEIVNVSIDLGNDSIEKAKTH